MFSPAKPKPVGSIWVSIGWSCTTKIAGHFHQPHPPRALDRRKILVARRKLSGGSLLRPGACLIPCGGPKGALGGRRARCRRVAPGRASGNSYRRGHGTSHTCPCGDRRRRRDAARRARVSAGRTIRRKNRLLRHRGSQRTGHQGIAGDASKRADHSRRSTSKTGSGYGPLRHSLASCGCMVGFGICRRARHPRRLAAWSVCHGDFSQAAL